MENMTKYELIKELPTFKKGEVFVLMGTGLHRYSDGLMAYAKATLDKYPNILDDWFRGIEEEVESQGLWEPKRGDKYYYIRNYASGGNDVASMTWDNDSVDQSLNEFGNVFCTEEEAEKTAEWLRARKVLFDDAKGFKPYWEDGDWTTLYFVGYNYKAHLLCASICLTTVPCPGPYFAMREDAEASIKAHEKEWKIYLGIEE